MKRNIIFLDKDNGGEYDGSYTIDCTEEQAKVIEDIVRLENKENDEYSQDSIVSRIKKEVGVEVKSAKDIVLWY